MKEPDRLIGFVTYDGAEIAFEFNSDDFVLNLYPDKNLWKKYVRPSYVFSKYQMDFTEHEWIPENRISGQTSAGQTIIFSTLGEPSSYSGFVTFNVNWYFCCYSGMNENNIRGFSIDGKTIDFFYSPFVALEQKHEYDEITKSSRMIVSSSKTTASSCGEYSLSDDIKASISVDAYSAAGLGNAEQPIFANSRFSIDYNVPVGINTVISTIEHVIRFFMYVTYRANINMRKFDLYSSDETGKNLSTGILVFPKEKRIEFEKDAKHHLIVYSDLKEKVGAIFESIKNEHITIQHVCSDYENRHSYPISRVILILAAFERFYGNIYGKDTERSDAYKEVKARVVEQIGLLESEYNTGRKKKYLNDFKKFVDNRDSSFSSNVVYALKDCADIMKPFILKKYKGNFDDIILDIGDRIGTVRNGVAHCKLDFTLEAIHLIDIHIIEELLYAMQLKHIKLTTHKCHIAIGRLFKENIHFPDDDNQTDT